MSTMVLHLQLSTVSITSALGRSISPKSVWEMAWAVGRRCSATSRRLSTSRFVGGKVTRPTLAYLYLFNPRSYNLTLHGHRTSTRPRLGAGGERKVGLAAVHAAEALKAAESSCVGEVKNSSCCLEVLLNSGSPSLARLELVRFLTEGGPVSKVWFEMI